MLGFKSTASAQRYCQCYDELRNFVRCAFRMCQYILLLRGVIATCAELPSPSASGKRHERESSLADCCANHKARDLTEPSGDVGLGVSAVDYGPAERPCDLRISTQSAKTAAEKDIVGCCSQYC